MKQQRMDSPAIFATTSSLLWCSKKSKNMDSDSSEEEGIRPCRRQRRSSARKAPDNGRSSVYCESSDDESFRSQDDEEAAPTLDPPMLTTTSSEETIDNLIGRRIRKYFPSHGWFWGEITSVDNTYYAIQYEDGDAEDMELDEVRKYLTEPKKRKRTKIGKKKAVQTKRKKPKPTKQQYDSDGDFVHNSDDEEDSDDEMLLSELLAQASHEAPSTDDEPDDEPDTKPKASTKKKPTKKPTAHTKQTKPTAPTKKHTVDPTKKKMYESFTPTNAPTFPKLSLATIQEEKEYLDACGMEATDDIIEHLIGDQVDKIGGLLLRCDDRDLLLGTACSGTDAPALAMTLVQEQLEWRGYENAFPYRHEFSCEVDPFKQAYLARNFDSILYPDIARLTSDEDDPDYTPRDVYGQEQKLPKINMFVAGTSCKNFSMLMNKYRIDVEDKGCSGETFFAAVNALYQEQPEYAIFENVTNAPWAKMQEYITGRVRLASCDSSKAIKDVKANAKKELVFILKSGDIVVEEVPPVYGVRCGAIVQGFLKGDDEMIHSVEWPSGKQDNKCTLNQLMKANGISKANDTLVFDTGGAIYCTKEIKVDSKDFGVPQTRNRTYLFVWRSDRIFDDLGDYWEAIVRHLKAPTRHSLDAFLLDDDHDIVRVFREALRGPPGRHTKRGNFLEPDFWTSSSSNLPHNQFPRKVLKLGDTARWFTNWGAFGQKQVPPNCWLEYLDCCGQRLLDMIDILYGSSIRDPEMHDPLFSSFFWNISQNASKEKHRAATPGVATCITPGGDLFLPHRGRPVLGCEKLMAQAIPYFRLILGNESEVQLGDLAGNAMTLTVVGATMLGAMTCKQLRAETLKEAGPNPKDVLRVRNDILSSRCSLEVKSDASAKRRVDDACQLAEERDSANLFTSLLALANDAISSSILCTCETSGCNSHATDFLECQVCRVSCCRNCLGSVSGYNLSSHDTVERNFAETDRGTSLFETRLREILPPSLRLRDEGWEELKGLRENAFRVDKLLGSIFHLHRVKRGHRKWLAIYYVRENSGMGEAIAELTIVVGAFRTVPSTANAQSVCGVSAEVKSFIPARTSPVQFGQLEPCCRMERSLSGYGDCDVWFGNSGHCTVEAEIKGFGSTPSIRKEVGLEDEVSEEIASKLEEKKNKDFIAAQKRGEERRWLYPDSWEAWPEKIVVSTSGNTQPFDGEYQRARCRQTTNQSALWVKGEGKPHFIIIRPNCHRTGPDSAIISSSVDFNDVTAIVAEFNRFWQPCDAFNMTRVELKIRKWQKLEDVSISLPNSKLNVSKGVDNEPNVLLRVEGMSSDQVQNLCQQMKQKENDIVVLNMSSGQQAQKTVRVFNSFLAAPILRFIAKGGLDFDLSPNAKWCPLGSPSSGVAFGQCELSVPRRPVESWKWNEDRSLFERTTEPGESRRYYQALQKAPKAFEVGVDEKDRSLVVRFHPEVVAHHAASNLIRGRGEPDRFNPVVTYKLSDVSQQPDPTLSPFVVHPCNDEAPIHVTLKPPFKLFERQAKALAKMVAIENGERQFDEIEMRDMALPGSVGLSLIAKARNETNIRGGVIADAIGAGKTVVSIGIILQGLEKARLKSDDPRKSPATLVVLPPALVDQWESEIKKFTSKLSVLKIYDRDALASIKIAEIRNCDVVLAPIDILESKGYLDKLFKMSGLEKFQGTKAPSLPTHASQKESNSARGVWIPSTSQDPYGGTNNPNNQRRRDQTAYYTVAYQEAIVALRKKTLADNTRGVPLEYFEWERIIVDEIHESLCTTKAELDESKENNKKSDNSTTGFFKEKNRRAGRELLGITQRDTALRPLVCRRGTFGLTGTPLLDNSNRVTELANLMGGVYVTGLSSHWRKLERESCRDIFLHNFLEPKQSREYRKTIYSKCQEYLNVACCRNKVGEEMDGIALNDEIVKINMSSAELEDYLNSQSGIPMDKRSLAIKPEDFDKTAGHDISKFLRQNARLTSRSRALVDICKTILSTNATTKIVVFTDGKIGAGLAAREALTESGIGCTWLDPEDSVKTKNRKIAWYQNADATAEDRKRPRVLVLHFEHAAGLNLQMECFNLILFSPLYVGEGGSLTDAVVDTSTELQAIGRVFRPGQLKPIVNVYRISVQGPNGEEALDGHLIRRNTDEATKQQAVNAG